MTTAAPTADAIREALRQAGDPARGAQVQVYLKSAMPCLGVGVPQTRRIVRTVVPVTADHDLRVALTEELWDGAGYREERFAAVTVLVDGTGLGRNARVVTAADLPLLRRLVLEGAWWDLVDELALVLARLRATDPQVMDPVACAWAGDDELWLRRVAVVALARDPDAPLDLLADVLEPNLDRSEFWLRKAVGWALRSRARSHPDWVRAYVDTHDGRLSPLSRREATRHLPSTT